MRLERCIESPARQLLLVEWERVEDHTERFRGSNEYQEWRQPLHHFYDPFPTVGRASAHSLIEGVSPCRRALGICQHDLPALTRTQLTAINNPTTMMR